jgi:hypothetical protein
VNKQVVFKSNIARLLGRMLFPTIGVLIFIGIVVIFVKEIYKQISAPAVNTCLESETKLFFVLLFFSFIRIFNKV